MLSLIELKAIREAIVNNDVSMLDELIRNAEQAVDKKSIDEIRFQTSVGVMEAKCALKLSNGDIADAIEWIRTNPCTI
jgi:NACalpha-BTF3-like transcription factor